MIPRYSLPEIADLFTDEARFGAWLEVEVLAVEAWAKLGVVPADDARGGPRARRLRRRRGPRARAGHRPRRRRVRRRRAGDASAQPGGRVGPLRAHVERRRRHRARRCQLTRALDLHPRRRRRARGGDRRPGPRVPRHADGRPHARHPRRADDVRREARAVGAAGPPRPRAAGAGARRRSRSASSRARSARTRTSTPRSRRYVCEHLGLDAGARDAGARPRPPRRGAVRVRVARRDDRVVRARDPPPAAHRGPRGRGAVPRGRAEGLERDAAQAQPGEVASSSAAWPACCAATCRPALEDVALWHERDISHSSVERIILPDSLMLAYYVLVQFTHDRRGHARVPRAHAAQPRRVVRPRVQPAGAARAGRGGHDAATTRTASCSATRCARGRRSARSATCSRDDPDVTAALDDDAARRLLRPEARARQRRPRRSTRSTRSSELGR